MMGKLASQAAAADCSNAGKPTSPVQKNALHTAMAYSAWQTLQLSMLQLPSFWFRCVPSMPASEGRCACGCNARTRKMDSAGQWNAHVLKKWNGHGITAKRHAIAVRRAAKLKMSSMMAARSKTPPTPPKECPATGGESLPPPAIGGESLPPAARVGGCLPPAALGGDPLPKITADARLNMLEETNKELERENASLRLALSHSAVASQTTVGNCCRHITFTAGAVLCFWKTPLIG